MVITVPSLDDGSGSNSINSISILPMTQEQKDWLLAIVDCDQPKMTRMLNQHPELAVWKITLSSSKFPGVELLPGGSLVDLEYADDIVLFGEDADKMQSLLTTLSNNASMFGMRFSPSKCKMLLQDWVTSTPELVIGSEVVECVDRFTYLGSLISPCGLVCNEISARIQKARLAFANLRHLWRRRDIRLPTKGRVYCAAVRSVLLYGCETWPVRVEDIRSLLVFDHRCLRNIVHISWDHRVSNAVVRKRVLGKDGKSIDEVVKLHQLRWLGHVLRIPTTGCLDVRCSVV
ncbi:unnamed protein product [Schistosoma margrebowiei]|uniref:Uncharacterized protein n=1 Tax=Schistosoma margrebowiei TaxID=48269 RepID=A0A183LUC5_9TREM|nr:unnamed protein product [Schistosoma margrebowiei]